MFFVFFRIFLWFLVHFIYKTDHFYFCFFCFAYKHYFVVNNKQSSIIKLNFCHCLIIQHYKYWKGTKKSNSFDWKKKTSFCMFFLLFYYQNLSYTVITKSVATNVKCFRIILFHFFVILATFSYIMLKI